MIWVATSRVSIARALLVRHVFGSGADRSAGCVHTRCIPTSWYAVKRLFLRCLCVKDCARVCGGTFVNRSGAKQNCSVSSALFCRCHSPCSDGCHEAL